ncbi:hypothetical protein EV360DRAFT_88928 [Lentinula raphanica]|nr:hypothetical protein EV360DRAFT_88928 [Lentinula raphanica]
MREQLNFQWDCLELSIRFWAPEAVPLWPVGPQVQGGLRGSPSGGAKYFPGKHSHKYTFVPHIFVLSIYSTPISGWTGDIVLLADTQITEHQMRFLTTLFPLVTLAVHIAATGTGTSAGIGTGSHTPGTGGTVSGTGTGTTNIDDPHTHDVELAQVPPAALRPDQLHDDPTLLQLPDCCREAVEQARRAWEAQLPPNARVVAVRRTTWKEVLPKSVIFGLVYTLVACPITCGLMLFYVYEWSHCTIADINNGKCGKITSRGLESRDEHVQKCPLIEQSVREHQCNGDARTLQGHGKRDVDRTIYRRRLNSSA